ncbi:hypothetical protein [Paenibacillus maysiensis]|uniref:hypothetical protein n=1 Tax=Paenibacillus maysiensis TaxID=1155954 RepID=UPI000471CBA6|nr:hypothetical protein [Paenibacillus maysiensis]
MPTISLNVPIPQVPGAYIEYEASDDDNTVKSTLYFAGIELGRDTFRIEDANAEGFSYAKHKKEYPHVAKLTFEVWIRWNERAIVLVLLYKSLLPGGGSGKTEVWGEW